MMPRKTRRRRLSFLTCLAFGSIHAGGCTTGLENIQPALSSGAAPAMTVMSSHPGYVTDGDAMVTIELANAADNQQLRVTFNGHDISSQFTPRGDGSVLQALVSGLSGGDNQLVAGLEGGPQASLTLTNHPIGGPVFSGPQLQPWTCTTRLSGLGEPTDSQCNAPTRTEYFYMSASQGQFLPYDPAQPPAADDVASTTTDEGVTTAYIVRLETGTLNRAQYQLAVLDDPSAAQDAWNNKLYIPLQGGFGHSYSQSVAQEQSPQAAVLNDMALRRGFMVAKTSFLRAGTNLDWVRAAESLAMLKEHVVEDYGPIRYTFSSGASGGSMQQYLVANSYPGLLQGIIPMAEYIDYWGEPSHEATDCIMLRRYMTQTSPGLWQDAADRIAVFGHAGEETCTFYGNIFPTSLTPSHGFAGPTVPEFDQSLMYDATDNPTGARATQQDYQVNYFGRRPAAVWSEAERAAGYGFALSLYDNFGVQYGLGALSAGTITAEQFVDLNERIGGFDIDFQPTPERTRQDEGAAALAYRMGFVNDARQLDQVAIISVRLPDVDPIASHSAIHSAIATDRLVRAQGHTENRALWMIPGYHAQEPHEMSFVAMDNWLTAVEADDSDRPLAEVVIASRPAGVVDGCWAPEAEEISLDNLIPELAGCMRDFYPVSATPRLVAAQGDLSSTMVTRCELKPLVRADYNAAFTDDQWRRLQATFPNGTCDWSQPDAAQRPSVPWLDYSNGPGGEPRVLD